ncbi:MAG: hypothetical protein LBT66_05895 [Methanobrevibacter sp.]|jgi:hypothetical protein|nr:hypothetical protein [Candidatus Methanovirga meridionalis]
MHSIHLDLTESRIFTIIQSKTDTSPSLLFNIASSTCIIIEYGIKIVK